MHKQVSLTDTIFSSAIIKRGQISYQKSESPPPATLTQFDFLPPPPQLMSLFSAMLNIQDNVQQILTM